eukprot:15476091-Alexandrium_andersonii.AAC.1
MAPEPPNASDGLVDRIVAQAPLARHWMRQDRPRVAIPNHQDSMCLVTGAFGKEALVHCDLRRIMCTSGGTRARQNGHPT